ncbi:MULTISPECIES: bacterial Ig-like domain-containing protein [Lactiplantibacillus]|uniref:Bacterial Ig-like domain-containing protein n=3 Tax=Lactiplantibacillus pentosus TaxID=1589 RepID=A0AAW8WCB6_LACPE|nr:MULTISPECIES: bacterial Ig-like domain-containing protein [Lactiplantibacillus]MBU7460106.1 bacterial Ig-like domain-containing protein [Lactiplantibacillus pentosus]MBU7478227.1 bacterial Ig-like domain-containing protein [Lactiplantibacillus pentosus]MBU7482806.1 bacterial Ig-like domain-containing protein [Lactiplantibacillus sp. 30.2.29]MBU7485999.1 bacterial Ig-like domain-containing protein [Lactiplantibacillus pentosus]MBU7499093.1 bacterial Ig-like domain-containing protein [Lactipl
MREQAKRYKMYKSGKIWVFAGITLITLNLTMINGRADDTDAAPVTDTATQVLPTEQQPELTLNKTEQTSGDNAARAEISDAPASAEAVTTDSQAADTVQESMVAAPAESHADASVQVSTEQPNQSVVSDQGVEAPAADGQLPVEPAPDVVVDHDSSSVHSDSGQVADHEADEATEIPDSLLVGPDVTATANEQPVLTESKDMVRRQEPRANELERGIQDTRRTEVTGNIGVNWWFDGETGVLSLGGGKLKPWHSMSSPWEWYTWFEQVTKVVITDTIVADKNMAGLFSDLKNVKSYVGLDKIDTSEVVSMRGLFMDNLNLTTLDLSSWNTSKLEEMRLIFGVAIYDRPKFSKLTSINLAGWDTSHVTDLSGAFLYCGSLRTVIGLEQFNTEKVTDMTAVFYGTAFSSLDVSNFSSESLTEMLWMFGGMRNVTSIKLGSKFDAALVQNFRALFVYSPKLEVLDISGLDMSRVTENNGMFLGDFSLKKLTLGPNTNLSKLLEAPSVGLPGPYLSEKYSGRWVNLDDPNDTLTTQELIARYSGNGAAMATYIWEANRAIIDLHDVTIDAGDDWNWSNSIDRLVDQFGNPVDVQALYAANPKAVKLRGDRVNTKRPGTYQVTFKYAGKTVTALVIVKADQTSLNVHDTDLHAGGTWQPQDAFDGATDKDGQPIDFSNVTVTGDVNSAVPGEYQVTYTVGNQSQTITVTVKENQASLNLHQHHVTVHTDGQGGSTWQPQTNFHNATDVDGQPVDWSAIEVIGMPDWTTAGDYQVTYQFKNQHGKLVAATVTITVVIEEDDEQGESQSALQVQDSTLQVGDTWQPEANVVVVMDVNGDTVPFDKLLVTGTVDTTKAGVYEITYQYTDASGKVFTEVVTVTVVEADDGDANGEQPDDGDDTDESEQPGDGSNTEQPGDGDANEPDESEQPDAGEQPARPDDGDDIDGSDEQGQSGNGSQTEQPSEQPQTGDTGSHGKPGGNNAGKPGTLGANNQGTNGKVPGKTGVNHGSNNHSSDVNGATQTVLADLSAGTDGQSRTGLNVRDQTTKQLGQASPSSSVQPATAKIGADYLPQTSEQASHSGVWGALLLGLTVCGGWLGLRRKQ